LPKLAPTLIDRPRVTSWLNRNADLPLRLVTAPAGFGKTTAIAHYLANANDGAAYLKIAQGESSALFWARAGSMLEMQPIPASYEEFLARLNGRAACELTIDEFDRAAPALLSEFNEIVCDSPACVRLIYVGQSRIAIDAERMITQGFAGALDAGDLAFDALEIARLAGLYGVRFSEDDVAELLAESDGWPIVIAGAMREATTRSSDLAGAFDIWCSQGGRHFAGYIASVLRHTSEFHRSAFRSAMRATEPLERSDQLAMLEARGLFVRYRDGRYEPMRVARRFFADESRPEPGLQTTVPMMMVRMFGRFEASIEGDPVEWIRRRDQQVFKYLLLKPDGTATRNEMRDAFWPQTESHQAMQSLRTAASNIRKAIAGVVGGELVDRYFFTRGNEIVVNLSNVVIDVRRFNAHTHDGDAQLERGNTREAMAHYRAAEDLYGGELLCGEYPEPWYAPRAEMYKAAFSTVLERLAELYHEEGDGRHAREYAARVLESQPQNLRMRHLQVGGPSAAQKPAVTGLLGFGRARALT
jgi:DNA-binding SARP family transcriptional activator